MRADQSEASIQSIDQSEAGNEQRLAVTFDPVTALSRENVKHSVSLDNVSSQDVSALTVNETNGFY